MIKIHHSADVQSKSIGEGTSIWQFCIVLPGAKIGKNCNICAFCFLENDVAIGNNVTIKSHISLWDGVEIDDNVHIGPNVVFTNDLRHRSKKKYELRRIHIGEGASIGANSTILAGTKIGKYVMTGIGSVITKDIPDYALVYGNPARIKGWVDEDGEKLEVWGEDTRRFKDGRILDINNGKIIKIDL